MYDILSQQKCSCCMAVSNLLKLFSSILTFLLKIFMDVLYLLVSSVELLFLDLSNVWIPL